MITSIHPKQTWQMKVGMYITAICILSLSIFLLYGKFERNNGDISIAVKDTDDSYQLVASYDDNATGRVQQYINNAIAPNSLFSSVNDYFDANTTLADQTHFYIKESPGRVKIKIDKRHNTFNSYMRIRKICEGVKEVLQSK